MSSELHEKYWFYRDRLKYFVIPGEGPGKSVVFGSRNHWELPDITIADQTIKLGWYIAVLATEYKQLGSQSLETNQTLTELYYAIKAFERLDLCEMYDPWFKDVAYKDGFFMRSDAQLMNDDPPIDFDEFNFGMTEDDDFKSRPPGLPAYIDNIWHTLDGNITEHDRKLDAMSQDQASQMIMGLGFVIKCLPYGDISFNNTITGEQNQHYNFVQNAINNVNNIGDYIANVDLGNGPLFFDFMEMEEDERYVWEAIFHLCYPIPYTLHQDVPSYWTTFDPNGDLVLRGPWVYIFRWGFKEAIKELTTHNIQTIFPHDLFADDGRIVWWAYSNVAPSTNHYNRINASSLAIIANSWTAPFTHTDGRVYDLLHYHRNDYLYLLAYILFQGPNTEANTPYINDGTGQYKGQFNSEFTIHDDLLKAPWCGPYQFWEEGAGDSLRFDFCGCDLPRLAPDGWGSSNYFRHKYDEKYGHDNTIEVSRGNYTGLDFMLYYNLFHYYLNWWYGWDYGYIPYRNMINSVSDQEYPYAENGSYNGTTSNPANLRAFNSFEYNGTISEENGNNGELNLIAGESIKLTPGFHVYQGGHFSAKIEEFDCWARSQDTKSSMFADNNYIEYEWEELPDNSPFITSEEETQEFEKNSPIKESGSIIVIPNPAKHQIQFQFETANISSYSLIIRDVYGNTIITETNYQSGANLNISTLSNGIYIAEVVINGQVYQEKFVVM